MWHLERGRQPDGRLVVREGLERISFAGEHTEALAGFMESAVRSGHRVAAQLGAAAGSRLAASRRV